MIETEDPTTWIVEQTHDYKIYENTDGRKWKISGRCIACGLCENKLGNIGDKETFTNIIIKNGIRETYTRTINWLEEPGTENACLEEEYHNRKDIPMTPDAINSIYGCSLSGEWII